jgi:hypothetical protein
MEPSDKTKLYDLESFFTNHGQKLRRYNIENPTYQKSKLSPKSENFIYEYYVNAYSSKKLSRQERQDTLGDLNNIGLSRQTLSKIEALPAFKQTPYLSAEVKQQFFFR